jgi:hypothetical protein
MSSSQKRNAANRRNAQRSTGPKSEAGRITSSRNSLRHGLTADKFLLSDEQAEDFEALRKSLMEDFAPIGEVEIQLAGYMIINLWRLKRVPRFEQTLFEVSEGQKPGDAFIRNAPAIATCTRYEASISRDLQRSAIQLERLQARRRGEAVPAPIAVNVTVTDGIEAEFSATQAQQPELHVTEVIEEEVSGTQAEQLELCWSEDEEGDPS